MVITKETVLCVGICLSCTISLVVSQDIPKKLSPMVYFENETGQILYESTAPIIFEFELPAWINESLMVFDHNCTDDKYAEDSYCSILYHFQQISSTMKSAIFLDSFNLPDTVQSTWGLKCGVISKHFSSLKVSPAVVQRYTEFLRYCSRGMILENDLNSDYSKSFRVHYENLLINFNEDYFQYFEDRRDRLHQGVFLTMGSTLLTLGFTQFLTESHRWKDAILHCKSGLIPDSIVTHEMFYTSLVKLNNSVTKNNYQFVISPSREFLPVYFKAPIADCTISSNKLIVRLLVPIKRINRNWSQVSVQSIPFRYQSETSSRAFIGMVKKHENKKTYFYESVNKNLFSSECDTSQPLFCRLPEKTDSTREIRKSCASALLLHNFNGNLSGYALSEIAKFCPIDYEDTTNMNFPLIKIQGSDKYFLVGEPTMNVTIKCDSAADQVFTPPVDGVLEIILPCNCKMIIDDEMFTSQLPCGQILKVSHILHPDRGWIHGVYNDSE